MGILSIDLGTSVPLGGTPILSFIDASQTVILGDTSIDILGDQVLLVWVPEPSVAVLLGVSLTGLALVRRREV